MNRRVFCILLAILLVLLTVVSAGCMATAAATTQTGTIVNTDHAKVHTRPKTNSPVIGTASRGSVYTVYEKTGNWYQIDFDGKTGYVKKKYLSVTTTTPASTPPPSAAPTSTAMPTQTPMSTSSPTNTPAQTAATGKVLAGYYASWAAYSGYTPLSIKAANLTHINYAFANIGSDLKITMGDPSVDPDNFAQLLELKEQNPHLKTIISIGGWTWSGKFSDVALSEASRTAFADSVVAFIKQYGFDGVDIDWEYPVAGGQSGNTVRPQDKENFTLLMATLREKLDAQGQLDNAHYLLTFAGASGMFYTQNVELDKLANYVDYAIVMAYDIHGPWDSYTDFNAPLYDPSETSPQYKWSCDAAIDLWISCGFPASKIVMGVPFYGYKYSGVSNANNGLYQTYSSCTSLAYDDIAAFYLNDADYTRFVHAGALVPYLFSTSTFISYDDVDSIGAKGAFIKQRDLAGASIWELSHNADGILIEALYQNMK